MRKYPKVLGLSALLCALLSLPELASPRRAHAEEPGLRLMSETSEYLDVIDAFDEGDPFDLNVVVGFLRTRTTGSIQREITDARSGDGRATQNFAAIADYERLRAELSIGLDVGVYRDVMVYGRVPLVLSDAQELTLPGGSTSADINPRLLDPGDNGGAAAQLFEVPFKSPTRSGVDWISLGAAWSIFNQNRDPVLPSWVVLLEGRFGVGEPVHPCFDQAPSGRQRCRGGDEPGVSRGTNALILESRTSWRSRYLETYGGLRFQIEWPAAADEQFLPEGDLAGIMNTIPSRTGELTLGALVVPWEHRGRFQRFAIDMRLTGAYVSEGHDYTPLFDALGTSNAPMLTTPRNEASDGSGRSVDFFGITDVQGHARFGGRLGLEMQAARYVRFTFGAGLAYVTPHLITFADACNPGESPRNSMDPRRGSCRVGIINPNYRETLDLAGRRFRLDGEMVFDLYASATAQF